jgi:hypothetical protein
MAQTKMPCMASDRTGTSITPRNPIPSTISASSSKKKETGKRINAAATLTARRRRKGGKSRMPQRRLKTSMNRRNRSQTIRLLTSACFDEFRLSQDGSAAHSHAPPVLVDRVEQRAI